MDEKDKENEFLTLASWKNVEVIKWKNVDGHVNYQVKFSYQDKDSGEWKDKRLPIFPSEVLDLKKAAELVEEDMFSRSSDLTKKIYE